MVTLSLKHKIKQGVDLLKNGGVVVFPTDTLYALGADAYSSHAVRRVFKIKSRGLSTPLPLFLSSTEEMKTVSINIPSVAYYLADRFWPGPLTLVLRKSPLVPDLVTGGRPTVAVRVPENPVALALLEAMDTPITGTSANISGSPDLFFIEEVQELLKNKVDLILDGALPNSGIASTIIDVSQDAPAIVRVGALDFIKIEKELGIQLKKADI